MIIEPIGAPIPGHEDEFDFRTRASLIKSNPHSHDLEGGNTPREGSLITLHIATRIPKCVWC